MKNIFIIILFASFFCYSKEVVVISNTRAQKLMNKSFSKGIMFNPVKDTFDRWCISKEEVLQVKDSAFLYLRVLNFIDYKKPADTLNILGK